MSEIILVNKLITIKELKDTASLRFGDMVKAVVDINKEIMAIGGELHADEEEFLLQLGSSQGNRSRGIESKELQDKISKVVNSLVN